jgi:hypothetical protein
MTESETPNPHRLDKKDVWMGALSAFLPVMAAVVLIVPLATIWIGPEQAPLKDWGVQFTIWYFLGVAIVFGYMFSRASKGEAMRAGKIESRDLLLGSVAGVTVVLVGVILLAWWRDKMDQAYLIKQGVRYVGMFLGLGVTTLMIVRRSTRPVPKAERVRPSSGNLSRGQQG